MTLDDERHDRCEGQIIRKILALSGKSCEYYYIRTIRELTKILKLFKESGYRYLHLSCHGSHRTMSTTFDRIDLAQLGEMIRRHLASRRLFVSACAMTNHTLARSVMSDSACNSILGPDEDIRFGDAAIMWASLYHVMFAADSTAITRSTLKAKAQEVANMYCVGLKYFGRDRSHPLGYVALRITPQDERAV